MRIKAPGDTGAAAHLASLRDERVHYGRRLVDQSRSLLEVLQEARGRPRDQEMQAGKRVDPGGGARHEAVKGSNQEHERGDQSTARSRVG
jgi:hypothetical protein